MDTDVLIVGAGPTGLMLANQLARRGARALIIDRHDGPSLQTRALGVQARTIEIYAQLGIADRALELGKRGTGANLWASPVGAQGMNTGLQDAYNLGWKLALVVAGRADAALLDSYEQERIPIARRLLNTTDRAFRLVVSENWISGLLRTKILARIAAFAMSRRRIQGVAFRVVSQIDISYPGSALSQTVDGMPQGAPRAGDRFPWLHLKLRADGVAEDVFRKLDDMCFNLIVIEQPSPPEVELGLGDLLHVHVVAADPVNDAEFARAQIPRPSFYLLRPDGHIGLCGVRADATAIQRYASACLRLVNTSA